MWVVRISKRCRYDAFLVIMYFFYANFFLKSLNFTDYSLSLQRQSERKDYIEESD